MIERSRFASTTQTPLKRHLLECTADMTWYVAPFGLLVSLIAFGFAAQLSPVAIVAVLVTLAAMSLPGIALLRRALPDEPSELFLLVFGAVLGLALSRFALAAVSLVFGPGPVSAGLLLLVLAIPSALALAKSGRRPWSEEDRYEGRWLLGLLAVQFLVMAVAYAAVGRPTEDGFAFAPYFDRDYMNHLAVTAELSRDVPPQNPYFAGERLHYYWGFHLWPAAVKSLTGVSARDALTASLLPTVGLFVAAVVLWARRYLDNRIARFAAVALGLFAFSYIGMLLLAKLTLPTIFERLPVVSSRSFSFLSHSWFRDFLYEPHAVTAMTLLLAVLAITDSGAALCRPGAGALIGLAFGAMLVTDAFIGAVGLLYFTLTNLPAFVRESSTRLPLLLAAGITLAVLGAAVTLEIFPVGSGTVTLAVHPMLKVAPAYLLIELGPLFVLGLFGAALAFLRSGLRPLRHLVGLLVLALAVGFILNAPVEPNIVIRKSLKVAQLPLVVLAGAAISAAWLSRRRVLWATAGAIVLLPGLVTLTTDVLLYHDLIEGRSDATTYVSRDEMEMLAWVRSKIPPEAVLQMGYPDRIFGGETPMMIEGLAERRTYYGNDEMPAMFRVPTAAIATRHTQVVALFKARNGAELAKTLRDFPLIYLYLDEEGAGPTRAVGECVASGLLREVHRSGRFALYKVVEVAGQ